MTHGACPGMLRYRLHVGSLTSAIALTRTVFFFKHFFLHGKRNIASQLQARAPMGQAHPKIAQAHPQSMPDTMCDRSRVAVAAVMSHVVWAGVYFIFVI